MNVSCGILLIPPHSPNFGGLWESNIKGVKHHLYRVIGDTLLTYEEFHTLIVQIEATLNSRPLYPMSNNPNDLQPLTPSHFLIGKPLVILPDLDYQDIKVNRLTRFQLIQQMHQGFWKQWSKLYLSQLQQKNKWKQGNGSVEIGRVTQLHPGQDQIVRVVTIKTAHGSYKRAVSKICPLPVPVPVPSQNEDCEPVLHDDVLNTDSAQGGSMGTKLKSERA